MSEELEPADWDIARLYRKPPAEELEYFHLLEVVNLDEVHPFLPLKAGNGMFRTYLMIGGVEFRPVILNGDSLRTVMLNTLKAEKKPIIVTKRENGTAVYEILGYAEAVEAYLASNPNAESNDPAYTLDIPYEDLISRPTP